MTIEQKEGGQVDQKQADSQTPPADDEKKEGGEQKEQGQEKQQQQPQYQIDHAQLARELIHGANQVDAQRRYEEQQAAQPTPDEIAAQKLLKNGADPEGLGHLVEFVDAKIKGAMQQTGNQFQQNQQEIAAKNFADACWKPFEDELDRLAEKLPIIDHAREHINKEIMVEFQKNYDDEMQKMAQWKKPSKTKAVECTKKVVNRLAKQWGYTVSSDSASARSSSPDPAPSQSGAIRSVDQLSAKGRKYYYAFLGDFGPEKTLQKAIAFESGG